MRLTISLPDDLHRALKEAAARRGKTASSVIAESLLYFGIKPREDAIQLVAAARGHRPMPEDRALELALAESRESRRQSSEQDS